MRSTVLLTSQFTLQIPSLSRSFFLLSLEPKLYFTFPRFLLGSSSYFWVGFEMSVNRESPPPPVIGKIGPYTVFMTPPSTPKPISQPVFDSPKKVVSPPPVQPPPQQFDKSITAPASDGSVFGFFKNAVSKAQNAHSSLDDHLARWFGLNQSKYQWALDDYYESKDLEKGDAKTKEFSSEVLSV